MEIQERFRQAVRQGDVTELRRLLEGKSEARGLVDQPLFAFDSPAIVHAAAQGQREVVDALLSMGADIHVRSSWWAGGFGVLDHERHELVPFLLERGARLDAYSAARHAMASDLQRLLDDEPGAAWARFGDGQTALHVAGSLAVAELLVERGADLDARDVDHESTAAQYLVAAKPDVAGFLIERGCGTDLLMAAAVGDAKLVKRHLDADAEAIRMRVSEEYFPMQDERAAGTIYLWTLGANRSAHQVAKRFKQAGVLAHLLERSPTDVRRVQACLTGEQRYLDGVVSAEAVRAEADRLSEVAEDNDVAAVKLMLANGWPVSGDGRRTPLHWACWHGNAEMAREILRYEPDLRVRDADYRGTPLDWAEHGEANGRFCKTGDYATVRRLLKEAMG